MGTDNPKVSAYVPQAIKDRLKEFRVEHSLSESQAVTAILAEYFGMAQSLTRSPEGLKAEGVTLARIEALEEKLANLTALPSDIPSELLEKIDQLSTSLRSVEERLEVVESSGLLSRPPSEVKEADLVIAPQAQETEGAVSYLDLGLEKDGCSPAEGASNSQIELIEPVSTNLLGEPLEEINPIPGVKLSKLRFGLPQAAIAGIKSRRSLEALTEWTKDKDPDHIAWRYVESPLKGYVPAEELSSELKSRLLKWIKENLQ